MPATRLYQTSENNVATAMVAKTYKISLFLGTGTQRVHSVFSQETVYAGYFADPGIECNDQNGVAGDLRIQGGHAVNLKSPLRTAGGSCRAALYAFLPV